MKQLQRTSLWLILLTFSLSFPAMGQTREELDRRYGPIDGNRYQVRQGIAVEVTFADNGKVLTFKVVPNVPNDKNVLLNIDDVREVIRELIPGRLCRRPLSYTEINVPCPFRKGCKGFQEEWKRATTLNVMQKKGVVYNLVTLKHDVIPPPNDMKLLPGYEHIPSCGIDTAVGYIKKPGGMEIHYDIGHIAGNFASRYAYKENAEWTKTERVGDDSILIVLNEERFIVATYEKANAIFSARVSSHSDIDDFLKMVLTYKGPRN